MSAVGLYRRHVLAGALMVGAGLSLARVAPPRSARRNLVSDEVIARRRSAKPPAFPDKGHDVIHVTNLDDGGPGSLRAAITASGRVKVVFDVAGEIPIRSDLKCIYNDVIIAGETAPSPGITILGDFVPMKLMGSSIECRHIRLMNTGGASTTYQDRDAGQIVTGRIDHADGLIENTGFRNCTFLWSADELASIFPNTRRFPERLFRDLYFTDCIFAEPVWNKQIRRDRHHMGLLIGSPPPNLNPTVGGGAVGAPVQRVLVARNLFHSCRERTPRWGHGTSGWAVNNVISNPGRLGLGDFGNAPDKWPHEVFPDVTTRVSHIGNVGWRGQEDEPFRGKFSQGLPPGSQIYWPRGGNEFDDLPWDVGPDDIVDAGFDPLVDEPPIPFPKGFTILQLPSVAGTVLAWAGSRPWDAHRADDRIIAEAVSRSGQFATDWPVRS